MFKKQLRLTLTLLTSLLLFAALTVPQYAGASGTAALSSPFQAVPQLPRGSITRQLPVFEWTSVPFAEQYEFTLLLGRTDGTFDPDYEQTLTVNEDVYCVEGRCWFNSPLIFDDQGGRYAWTVTPVTSRPEWTQWAGEDGRGVPAPALVFETFPNDPPIDSGPLGAPELVGPEGSTEKTDPNFDQPFRWSLVDDADSYAFWIGYEDENDLYSIYAGTFDPNDDDGDLLDCRLGGSCFLEPPFPMTGLTYTWAVQGQNEDGPGPWSEPMTYTIIQPEVWQYEFDLQADLEVSVVPRPQERMLQPDSILVLDIFVRNNGPDDVQDVRLDILRDRNVVRYARASGDGEFNQQFGLWDAGDLDAHDGAQLTLSVGLREAGLHSIGAELFNVDLFDPNSAPRDGAGNDFDSIEVQVIDPGGAVVYDAWGPRP